MGNDLVFTGKARPHYFLPGNVYDAARKRIRWLFDEFDGKVSASVSGGKDSTVVAELLADVSQELGCGPAHLHFLDQEAEYQATIDYMRLYLDRPDRYKLDWYQIPFRLFNAASYDEEWLYVWDTRLDDSGWIRPKEPSSIKVNDFFTPRGHQIDRFKEVLGAMNQRDGGAILTGMRCEESPTRRVFMTSVPSYKWATWASAGKPKGSYYLFHPIYDWSYRDVWKSIHDNEWAYNTFYDVQFQYGIPLRNMRVSSFHHELSLASLNYLQEVEPDTWERATRRLEGLNSFAHVGEDQFQQRGKLPYMFASWDEYLEYLICKLIPKPENQDKFRRMIVRATKALPQLSHEEVMVSMSAAIMGNDVYGTSVDQWISSNTPAARRYLAGDLTAASTARQRELEQEARSASYAG